MNVFKWTLRYSLSIAGIILAGLATPSASQTPRKRTAPSTPPPPPTVAQVGSVEGDAYLLMQSGDVKKGAGRTIYLLRGGAALESARQAVCDNFSQQRTGILDPLRAVYKAVKDSSDAAYKMYLDDILNSRKRDAWNVLSNRSIAAISAVAAREEVLIASMKVVMDSVLGGYLVDTVGTGMNAHFKFGALPGGDFVLYGQFPISSNRYVWWAPLTLRPGQRMTRDLDNSVEIGTALYCGQPFR